MFLKTLLGLYSARLPAVLVSAFRAGNNSVPAYLSWFHSQRSLALPEGAVDQSRSQLTRTMQLFALAWLVLLGVLTAKTLNGKYDGFWAFTVATAMAYPIIMAYGLAVFEWVGQFSQNILHPKRIVRSLVCNVLEWQVKRLRKKHKFKVIAVSGSVGKTTTKLAIAQMLGQTKRVQFQRGNYNDRVTVPLVFFGHKSPNLYNPFAWARLVGHNEAAIASKYPYDFVVVEIGTDGPGQMRDFAYLRPDICVVTAISPEHMENFDGLEGVMAEEQNVFKYSKIVLINTDDTPSEFYKDKKYISYGFQVGSDYAAKLKPHNLNQQTLSISKAKRTFVVSTGLVGTQGAKSMLAAVSVADLLDVPASKIEESSIAVRQCPGRMQVLKGLKNSTLIDDCYNSSPIAVKAALDVLYDNKALQKIAIIGSMNELGGYSKQAHQEIGEYCDAKQIDLLVTVGADAKRWLAVAAKARGCNVRSFLSPYDAGRFVAARLKSGAVVLAKGSQNKIYTEEALRKLLAHPIDAKKLVRQDKSWQILKLKQFPEQ